MSLAGFDVLVEAAFFHLHDHPGWYDVLHKILLLTTVDGALLSLEYHLRLLGRGLGNAALGSPRNDCCLELYPCVDGVVYRSRDLKYRLHHPQHRAYCDTVCRTIIRKFSLGENL